MRDEAVIALILVLVIASAGAGYYVGASGVRPTTTTSTKLLTTTETRIVTSTYVMPACESYRHSVEGTYSNSSYVVFDTNSTGALCVSLDWGGSDNLTLSQPPTVWVDKNGTWANSSGLNVTLVPSIQLPPLSVESFLFEITVLNRTQAIYTVGLPTPCGSFAFVAVGYSVSQLQETQLDLPPIILNCGLGPFSTIFGFANMTATFTK